MSEVITGKDIGLTAVKGRLLVTKEVANFLRVSERWVQHHMSNGTFPVRWYLIGWHRVVDSYDLNEWLQKVVFSAGTAQLPLMAAKKIQKEVSAL